MRSFKTLKIRQPAFADFSYGSYISYPYDSLAKFAFILTFL